MAITNLKQLEAAVNKKASQVLKNTIAPIAKKAMQEIIEDEVYNAYTPKVYKRTGDLERDIEITNIDANTISIEDTRSQGNKNIAEIIEYGVGYTFKSPEYDTYDNQGRTYERPRPFTAETRKFLKESGILQREMRDGLKKLGLDVK